MFRTLARRLLTSLALIGLGVCGVVGESAAHTINSKTNSTPNITVGGIATYTITVSSAGQSSPSTGMTTVDTLPPGFAYRSTQSITLVNGATNTGAVVPTPGSTTPQWGLFTNPNNSSTAGSPVSQYSITFDVDVLNPTCGSSVTNTANTVGGTQHAVLIPATNTAPLNVTGPAPAMTVTKTTSTPVIINSGSGLQAIYTIVVNNASGTCAATGVNITDTLPAGYTYASTGAITFTGSPAAASRPSGSNPTAGAANPVWTGFVIPAGTSANLTFTASIANGTANGTYYNSASATAAESGATIGNFGPGAPVQLVPASLSKTFTPALIPVGTTSVLTFTISKPAGAAASGVNFTEALPANVTVSGTPAASQCGGTVSNTATSLTVTGASLAAAATSCTIAANVTSNVAGVYTNNSGNISGLAGGLSAAAVNATLTVSNSALTKAFLTPVIGAGSSSVMRFTLTNSAGAAQVGLGFTETLPVSVTVVPGFAVSQCAGVVSSSGPQNVTVAGASLAAGASCNIDVTVTSTVPGTYVNGPGQISGLAGGVTANGVSATLTVSGTILQKSFNPSNIGVGGTSLLTFTIGNTAGSPAQPGLGFTETLPANVTRVAGFTASQCGGTVSSSGPQNITFTGGSLASGVSQCTISVNATSSVIGTYVNNSAQISGASIGMDTSGVNASLTVGNVVLTKAFANSPVNVTTVLALTFTLTNSPGNPAQSGIAFTDTFPAGLVLANGTSAFGAGCAGTLTDSTGVPLAAGGPGTKLAGGTMTAGTASCNITVNVTSATPGTYINNSARISGASSGLGTGGVNATAQFNGANLVVSKVTSTPAVDIVGAANGLATYTLTVANSGNATATGVTITDTLPLGFTYAATGAITLNGGATQPSTTNPVAGAPVPAWSSFTIPGGGSVVLTFDATIPNATASGTYNNSASVTTTTAGTGITNYDGTLAGNTAEDVVVRRLADLTITKTQVTANPVSRGQAGVQFTLTVNNIGAAPKASPNLVTVTDNAPAGMTITAMSGTGWTCSIPTCSRTDVLNNGASYPVITVTVAIDANAASSLTNSSTVALSGQTESNTNNNTGNAPGTVVNPNVALTKLSSPNPMGVNGTSTLTFTLTNGTGNPPQSGLAFTDTLPANVTVATPAGVVNNCGGAVTATAGSGTITLANGGLAAGAPSCTVSVQITSAVPGSYANTVTNISGLGGGLTGGGVNDTLNVRGTTLTKAFGPASVGIGQTSVLTFTLTNGSGNPAQSGLAFTDTFPAGLIIAAANGLVNTCGGSVAATPGSGAFSLAGGSMAAGTATCTIAVNALSNTASAYVNNGSNISGASAGMTTTGVNATLTVATTLTIGKAFSPATIGVNGTSVLTITLTNGNATAVTGAAFTDTYPAGLVNTGSASGATTCGSGTVTAVNGTASVALASGTVPASGSCTVTVNVTSAAAGGYTNSTGPVTTTNAGTAAAGSATLTVLAPPTIGKAFSPASIGAGGVSTLTLTLTNPSGTTATGLAFSDTYPPGLVDAPSPNLTNTCGGTATGGLAGGNTVGLTGGSLAGGASCTISVNTTSAATGSYANTSGAVSSTNGGTGNTATATLTVIGQPTIAKTFSPASVASGGTSTLTLTITNSVATALSGAAFTDTFPAGMTVAATPALTNTCGGTIAGGASGNNTLNLSNGSVPGGGSCAISVAVTASGAGTYNNSASGVSSTQTGSAGAASNTATLTVLAPPLIAKAFSPTVVGVNGASTLTFTLSNSNAFALTGAAFSDTYPAGLVNAAAPTVSNSCGGSTSGGAAGGNTIGLTGGGIPASGSCTVSVAVTSAAIGTYNNTSGAVSSGNGGTGNTASASLTVSANPSISKAFSPTIIAAGGVSTVTFVLSNSAAVPALAAAFTDNLPTGLVVATPASPSNTCTGTLTASAGSNSINLTNGAIPGLGSCTISVNVTAAAGGTYPNTSSAVSSLLGSGNPSNTATLTVTTPATIVKSFSPATILANGSSTMTFAINNPNPVALTAMGFSDPFPAGGLQVAAIPNVTNSCGGTLAGATPGSTSLTFSGGSLASGASCSITVVVTSPNPGTFSNATSGVSASQTATGPGSNASLLTATAPDLTLTKSHSGNFTVGVNGVYTLVVNNTLGTAPSSGTITVADTLPTGLGFVSASGTGWTCSAVGQVVTCTSSTLIGTGASSANPITLTVSVAATARPSVTNSASVSGGGEPAANAGNDNAYDPTVIVLAAQNTFLTDGQQTALPGTTLFYTHQFNAGLSGTVAFGTSNAATPSVNGWNNVVYRDSNCNGVLDGTEGNTPLTASISVNPGDLICIVVQEFIPANAPYNARDVITVTATFTPGAGPVATYTHTDISTVGNASGAGLALQKTVRNVTTGGTGVTSNAARPGETLEYTITYLNNGADPLATIVINDSTPAFTTFVSASCGAPLPANISACNVTTQPVAGGTGGIVWTLNGPLASTASGTVVFRVQLQ